MKKRARAIEMEGVARVMVGMIGGRWEWGAEGMSATGDVELLGKFWKKRWEMCCRTDLWRASFPLRVRRAAVPGGSWASLGISAEEKKGSLRDAGCGAVLVS